MKLERLTYEPGAVLEFYQEALSSLGALCDRTWHDRLEVVAEGRAATLWQTDGALHSTELHFAPADATGARHADREIFPGSPLTFHLSETLRPSPLALERLVMSDPAAGRVPDPAVAEKLWRTQFPETRSWRLRKGFTADFHFSVLALARCEIQAIDQHWSLHRVGISLPGGEPDQLLASELHFVQCDSANAQDVPWPTPEPARWSDLMRRALEQDLAPELGQIRLRQENSLARELDRLDSYFEHYAAELTGRARRTAKEAVRIKTSERLAAAKAEHARRRADQVTRHEIRIRVQFDALVLIAEPAWRVELQVEHQHQQQTRDAIFVPRARRWSAWPQPP
jgi:hypothetical protein